MFAVLVKTKIIIYESNIFFRMLGKFPEYFQKFSGKYFSGKLTSQICAFELVLIVQTMHSF